MTYPHLLVLWVDFSEYHKHKCSSLVWSPCVTLGLTNRIFWKTPLLSCMQGGEVMGGGRGGRNPRYITVGNLREVAKGNPRAIHQINVVWSDKPVRFLGPSSGLMGCSQHFNRPCRNFKGSGGMLPLGEEVAEGKVQQLEGELKLRGRRFHSSLRQ